MHQTIYSKLIYTDSLKPHTLKQPQVRSLVSKKVWYSFTPGASLCWDSWLPLLTSSFLTEPKLNMSDRHPATTHTHTYTRLQRSLYSVLLSFLSVFLQLIWLVLRAVCSTSGSDWLSLNDVERFNWTEPKLSWTESLFTTCARKSIHLHQLKNAVCLSMLSSITAFVKIISQQQLW